MVTDGEDNGSHNSLELTLQRVAESGSPTIYAIGILEAEKDRLAKRAKRALQALTEQTGGIAFFPKNFEEVDSVSQAVAHDIRNQYTIGDRKSTRLNSSHIQKSRMPSSA